MRTTIDLDPDVDARLRQLARERRVPLRVVINDALRAATAGNGVGEEAEPYRLPRHSLGIRPGIDLDKAWQLLGDLDDEEFIRKAQLGK